MNPVCPATIQQFKTTLVLGLGNDLLSDDGIGLTVAGALASLVSRQAGVRVIQTTESGLALLDLLIGFDQLIVIDAIITGKAAPGTLHQFQIQELPITSSLPPHFLGLGEILTLGRMLGLQMPVEVRVLGIEVQDIFTISTELTPALRSALPGLVAKCTDFSEDFIRF